MFRSEFVRGMIAAATALGPRKIDDCYENPVLPYDRPLDIKMRVLDGPDFHLMSYRGYAVWVNIFATWCEPCNQEQGLVQTLADSYFDRGLRVIGMNFRESDDSVRKYRKRYRLTYPLAMDQSGGFTKALESGTSGGNLVFPASLFVTAQGYLDCYIQGSMGNAEMRFKIERLLESISTLPPSPTPYPTFKP
ncbi:MAG: TlpA family protein disulfide reductase [Vulcanimicrobiaceae bacterium]